MFSRRIVGLFKNLRVFNTYDSSVIALKYSTKMNDQPEMGDECLETILDGIGGADYRPSMDLKA
jgi:hypothetical protein